MDFQDKKTMIRALAKLRASLDGSPSLWWYQGAQYGVADMESRILWQVEGAQMSKFEPLGDGGCRHTMRDIMFYFDAETGELLRTFTNPWTDEVVDVPIARFGPFSVNYTLDGHTVDLPPQVKASMSSTWMYEPVVTQGNDVYIREAGVTKIAKPGAKTGTAADYHHINDYLTMFGRLSDIEDDKVIEAPARNTYGSANDWTPWLKMGDRQGFVLGRGNSTKLARIEDLPEHLRKLIDEHEPEFFKDPTFSIWNKTFHPLDNER